jgi:hypothetical protein
MSKKAITTGPFRVPQRVTGTIGPPSRVFVNLKNPTHSEKKVRVIVEECPPIQVPVVPPGERCAVSNQVTAIEICNEVITLNPESCRQLFLQLTVSTVILRITVKGDVDEDAEKVEVSVIGTDSSGINHEPTMFFRHEDFVEVDDD